MGSRDRGVASSVGKWAEGRSEAEGAVAAWPAPAVKRSGSRLRPNPKFPRTALPHRRGAHVQKRSNLKRQNQYQKYEVLARPERERLRTASPHSGPPHATGVLLLAAQRRLAAAFLSSRTSHHWAWGCTESHVL